MIRSALPSRNHAACLLRPLGMMLFCGLALLLASVSPSMAATGLQGYEPIEIRELADELARQQAVPPAKISDLLINLEAALQDPVIAGAVRSGWIRGVLVYRSVEAGVVVKYMQGEGMVSFKNGKQQGPIRLRAWSAGAQVGGSASWGIGLVTDLVKESHFGGEYRGLVTDATIADSTTRRPLVMDKYKPGAGAGNRIFLILTGTGVSANAGFAKITIDRGW